MFKMNYRVAILGNHRPQFSTETEWSLAFELLGWEVVRIQEDNCYANDCLDCEPDLLWWVHTHGFTPRGISMFDVIAKLRERHIPTVSVHLDTFVGLRTLDNREARVGVEPFWKTDFVFTTDGGNQDFFRERNVNHVWAPPAIGDRHCWLGTPNPAYAADVIFIGSRAYHPEYPFREQLVSWLDRIDFHPFSVKRWGGDRLGARAELNEIIASAKIVVGDSCFAGAPYSWSDRVTETQGRGGFLVHPSSEGMNVTGMATYKPQDLGDLDSVIRYWLEPEHEAKREEMRLAGFEWTKKNHTCTRRILEILNRVSRDSGVELN
jgi:Glycosyl transferases group 1